MSKREKPIHKTSIGGQALIEGIMMKGPRVSSMAVRKPDGEILVEEWPTHKGKIPWYKRCPILRGSFNFVGMMVEGSRVMMRSAEISGLEEEEEPSRLERWLSEKLGDRMTKFISGLAFVIAIPLAVLLFMLLPAWLSSLCAGFIHAPVALTAIEGVLKITIFIAYMAAVAQMKEIARVFQYHGAEHKTIACYEAGEELTVENIQRHTRFHPRCGTSFILIALVLSILVFSVVTWSNIWVRVALKLLLLPVVVGLAYEVIKLAGRYDNPLTRAISAPGLWLQRITTNEPADEMVEVAIAAMQRVIPENKEEDRW